MTSDDEITKTSVTTITLCGVQGCCPTVEVHDNDDKVVISDDHGGSVTLTKREWRDAVTKVKV